MCRMVLHDLFVTFKKKIEKIIRYFKYGSKIDDLRFKKKKQQQQQLHKYLTRYKNVVNDIIFHLTKPQLHFVHEDEIPSI